MKTKSMLIAAIAALLVSTAVSALDSGRIEMSGDWFAIKMQDEFTGATACFVTGSRAEVRFNRSSISVSIDGKIVSDDGQLIDILVLLSGKHGVHTESFSDPSKIQILIDKERVDLADQATFVEAAKAGVKMVYRWSDRYGGTHTNSVSLNGFAKAWDAARAACPKQQAE